MDELKNVIDASGKSYDVDRKIGEGGQGRIFLLKDGTHIVKLFQGGSRSSTMKSDINYLIKLGLDRRHYAVPLREIVSPAPGYIAEFASGMIPLTGLKWKGQADNFTEWYKGTGGTLKRYRVLANLAYILRSLHAKGLTYCDLSPNNIYVSSSPDKAAVFLLDMDNVRHKTGLMHNIFTPFYGAPEIVNKTDANTPMSDCFSFAVIAYELLTSSHPLIGDYVDEDADREPDALGGNIPWVEDSNNSINHRSTGIESKYFVSSYMMRLFQKTFESGLNEPNKRPDMFDWYDTMVDSMNGLLTCPECGIDYPFDRFGHCTNCGKKPDTVLHVVMRSWDETGKYDKEEKAIFGVDLTPREDIVFDAHTSKDITSADFLTSVSDIPEPFLRIRVKEFKDGMPIIVLEPLGGKEYFLYTMAGKALEKMPSFKSPIRVRVGQVNLESRLMVTHEKLTNKPQRVLTIE